MASPTTSAQLQDEILRRLGAPTIQVEVTPEQVRDCIDRAIELFTEYHHEGSKKVYFTLQVTQQDIDNGGIFLIDRPILAITDILYSSGNDASAMGLARDFISAFPRWIGYAHTSSGTAQGMFSQYNTFSLLTADLWTQYLKEFQIRYRNDLIWEHNRYTNQLQVFNSLHCGQLIVMECWVPVAVPTSELLVPVVQDGDWNPGQAEDATLPQYNVPEDVQMILKDRWVRDYATSLVKQLNGTVLKKFSGQKLPGGIEVNGQQMFDEATAEIERLREELYDLEQPLPIIMG